MSIQRINLCRIGLRLSGSIETLHHPLLAPLLLCRPIASALLHHLVILVIFGHILVGYFGSILMGYFAGHMCCYFSSILVGYFAGHIRVSLKLINWGLFLTFLSYKTLPNEFDLIKLNDQHRGCSFLYRSLILTNLSFIVGWTARHFLETACFILWKTIETLKMIVNKES